MSAITDKTNSLVNKINEISKKFEIAEEVTSDEIVDYVTEKVNNVTSFAESSSDISASDILNLTAMTQDFKFIRETLTENIKNGRRILDVVTLELLDADESTRLELITAFTELNNSIANNLKIYTTSYKEISTVLLNIDKISKNSSDSSSKTTHHTMNTVNNVIITPKTTTELIAELMAVKD